MPYSGPVPITLMARPTTMFTETTDTATHAPRQNALRRSRNDRLDNQWQRVDTNLRRPRARRDRPSDRSHRENNPADGRTTQSTRCVKSGFIAGERRSQNLLFQRGPDDAAGTARYCSEAAGRHEPGNGDCAYAARQFLQFVE